MKNVFKWLLIFSIVAVIGFSFSSCDLPDDEASFTIQNSDWIIINNSSSYELKVTIKDSRYANGTTTIRAGSSYTRTSLTPPITITYSPASKVKYTSSVYETHSTITFK